MEGLAHGAWSKQDVEGVTRLSAWVESECWVRGVAWGGHGQAGLGLGFQESGTFRDGWGGLLSRDPQLSQAASRAPPRGRLRLWWRAGDPAVPWEPGLLVSRD